MADVRVLGAVLPLVFVGEPGSRHLLWIDPSLGETVNTFGPGLLSVYEALYYVIT